MEESADLTARYRNEFDRLQAEQAAVDQTIQFLIKLKANLRLDADTVLDKLAAVTVGHARSVPIKRLHR